VQRRPRAAQIFTEIRMMRMNEDKVCHVYVLTYAVQYV